MRSYVRPVVAAAHDGGQDGFPRREFQTGSRLVMPLGPRNVSRLGIDRSHPPLRREQACGLPAGRLLGLPGKRLCLLRRRAQRPLCPRHCPSSAVIALAASVANNALARAGSSGSILSSPLAATSPNSAAYPRLIVTLNAIVRSGQALGPCQSCVTTKTVDIRLRRVPGDSCLTAPGAARSPDARRHRRASSPR